MFTCPDCERRSTERPIVCPNCGHESMPPMEQVVRPPVTVEVFHSFASVGLMVGTITALLFLKIDCVALPLLGLTRGLATHDTWRCIKGVLVSGVLALLFGMPVFSYHPALSTGVLRFEPEYIYQGAVLGSVLGAALQAPRGISLWIAPLFAVLSAFNFGLVIFALRAKFPHLGANWDILVVLISIPAFGLGIWWPVDFVRGRLWKLGLETP